MTTTLLSLLLFLTSSVVATAMPVDPTPRPIQQANGRSVLVRPIGGERFNIFVTTDGLPVYRNEKTGNYDYALLEQGFLVASGIPAANVGERTEGELAFLATYNPSQIFLWNQKQVKKTAHNHIYAKYNDYPTIGRQKSLVILVEFSDVAFTQPNPKDLFTRMLNEKGFTHTNGANGSAADYYRHQSNGRFDPEYVVVGPIKMPKEYAHYGKNENGRKDVNIREMVNEACRMADDSVDYATFDSDNDGNVDNIFFFYAGHGEADYYNNDENVIWPHAWSTYGVRLDGKNIRGYACANEITAQGALTGIGTFCHEFGHVLGLPDFYATNGSGTAITPRAWSLMDVGSYNNHGHTPPNLSAYERAELGWHEYTELHDNTDTACYLRPFGHNDNDRSYRIAVPNRPNEFYVLENRQKKGYDQYLLGHGMLVWHIDYDRDTWFANSVNTDPDHQRVDVVEAGGATSPFAAHPFPGTKKVREHLFTSWAGDELMRIVEITETDSNIHFLLDGTVLNLQPPTDLAADSLAKDIVRLVWKAAPSAAAYLVNVSTYNEKGELVPLKAYTNKRVSTLGLMLTGLTPSTPYVITVQSVFGSHTSDKATLELTTPSTPFNELVVHTFPATQVKDKSARVSWTAVEGAEQYTLRLYELKLAAQTASTCYGFDDQAAGLPEGWTTESKTYNTNTSFSVTPPSLRLLSEETLTIAPKAAVVDSISFWLRTPASSGYLFVEALRNDQWEKIDSLAPPRVATRVGYATKNALSVRLRYVPAVTTRAVLIDDVCAEYRQVALEEVASLPTTATSHQWESLTPATHYLYTVHATKGAATTRVSTPIDFVTMKVSGIAGVKTDKASEKVFDLMGRSVTTPLRQGVYVVNGKKVVVR